MTSGSELRAVFLVAFVYYACVRERVLRPCVRARTNRAIGAHARLRDHKWQRRKSGVNGDIARLRQKLGNNNLQQKKKNG